MHPDLKEWVKRNSRVAKKEERFSVYELNTTPLREDEERKIVEVSVGPKCKDEVMTVLLLGESGAGKTAFLNAFLNVVFGVDIDDEVRLKLKEQNPHCHTSFLIYHQEGMPYPFNYKVVDTLGLGDDDGANQRALKEYLSDEEAISHLSCVALIWKSSSRRLDERSQEILSKVKNLMSPDMESLTEALLTFSSREDSSVVGAIEESGVVFNKVFHFDNTVLYQCPNDEKRRKMHEMVWSSTVDNHKEFLEELNQKQLKSLQNTARIFKLEIEKENMKTELENKRNQEMKYEELNRKHEETLTKLKETEAARDTEQKKNKELSKLLSNLTERQEKKEEEQRKLKEASTGFLSSFSRFLPSFSSSPPAAQDKQAPFSCEDAAEAYEKSLNYN